jgi:hypothetical protein
MSTDLIVAPQAGAALTQGFGTREIELRAETATAAVAAQAKAAVEARYILAMQRPRNMDEVRVRILNDCKRPTFADSAMYRLPRGGKTIEGLSIRFAEAALRSMGNIMPEVSVIYEDAGKRILQVMVTDLEANLTYSNQIVIDKTVERRNAEKRVVLNERTNSTGETVYIVMATEDELLQKQQALVSKAMRTAALRLLPGYIADEAEVVIKATLRDRAAQDPDKEKTDIIDAFDAIGVGPKDLAVYLGHPLERIQPAEMAELRQVYRTIKDGEATWEEVLGGKSTTGSQELQDDVRDKKLADLQNKQPGFKLSSKEPKS